MVSSSPNEGDYAVAMLFLQATQKVWAWQNASSRTAVPQKVFLCSFGVTFPSTPTI
jgi:hypothetical protein